MDLGLFMQPLHDPKKRSFTEMVDHDYEVAVFIDKLGFDEIWVGEHYSCAVEPISSPLQFLASIMRETKLKLGTGVINMPIHHPAKLAGEIALLDHMSKGRVIMGVGPGGLPTDSEVFGSLGKNQGEMLAESVGMIHKIWASDPPYNIQGKYWNVKIEDAIAPKLGFGPMLKPFQQPHPPVVVSIMSPNSKSAFQAGEKGWGIISANFVQAKWAKSHWDQYVMGCEKAGRRPDRQNWRVARSILVTNSDAEAAEYLAKEDTSYGWYYNFMIDDMKEFNIAGVLKASEDLSDEDLTVKYCLDTMVMSGSPKTVLDKLVEFVDYVGGPFGGLVACFKEWDDAKIHQNSLRLLAENVMPKLRDYCASKVAAE